MHPHERQDASFPDKHYIIPIWSILFTSPVRDFKVFTDQCRFRIDLCWTKHPSINGIVCLCIVTSTHTIIWSPVALLTGLVTPTEQRNKGTQWVSLDVFWRTILYYHNTAHDFVLLTGYCTGQPIDTRKWFTVNRMITTDRVSVDTHTHTHTCPLSLVICAH